MGADRRVVLEHAASRAQQRLWFVERLAPGEPLHNVNVELRFGEDVDAAAFRAAVDDLVDRHEALRTVLRTGSGDAGAELRQVVYSGLEDSPLRFTDCSQQADPQAAWSEIRAAEAGRPFDLERGPLLRAHLVRVSGRDHRLALVVHHTVCDAWSVGVMIADLCTAYAARREGHGPSWTPLPVQYADFTAWQEQRLSGARAAVDLAYWRTQLADLPTVDLTRGRPRPAEPTHRGGRVELALPRDAVDRLTAVAAAEGATAFMAFAALWAEAVGRWFGCRDVALGTPVAGRPLAEVAGVVGLFVDRLVLRMDTSGAPTPREAVRRARDVVLDAHEHDAVTFEQVVDAVRPERRLGVTPLFQVGINLVPLPPPVVPVTGQRSVAVVGGGQYPNGTVRHDLNLDLAEQQDGLSGAVEYRFDVVAEADARGVADLFERLLVRAGAEPDRPLRQVPTLLDRSAAVRDGGPAAGPPALVDALVAQAARRHPTAPAVVAPGARLTYADLLAHAHTLARDLAGLGVGPEAAVLLAVPRRAELVVGLLGVLAAGGAYVPVDPAAPAAHLAAVAADAGARLALVLPGAAVALPPGVGRVELRLPPAAPADPGPPPNAARPDNAAYVLFTSGSTGAPKGVVVEHRHLAAYVHACRRLLDPPPGASYLMVQPPTFDSCATQIYGALTTGGTLHLVDEDTARDPDALGRYCADHPVDYLKIAPSHLAALLSGGERRLVPRRAVVLGGEGCGRRFTRDLAAAGWTVVAHYGPTETTVGVLGEPLTDQTGGDCPTTPLGDPFAGVRAYVLDERGDPVPAGCAGELYVGGDLVARGYAARPGQTARAFLPDPFAAVPGARMYRTGDLVRALPDGGYEFCGRVDRQVKVAGQRVEPGAVEAVLEGHPAVRRAVVVPRGNALVGYVTCDPATRPAGDAALAAALRDRVAAALPAYCVPAAVVVLDRLPLTARGKLDTAALPDPARAAAADWPVAPQNPAEEALLAIWRRVLDRDDVGVTDPFFDHGGDSIRVIEMVAAARRAGLPLTARDVFERPTVRELARVAAAAAGGPAVAAAGAGLDGLGGVVTLAGGIAELAAALRGLTGSSPALAPLVAPAVGPPALSVVPAAGGAALAADPLRAGDEVLAAAAWALAGGGRPVPPGDAPAPPPPGGGDRDDGEWRRALADVVPVLPLLHGAGAPATARRRLPDRTRVALAGPAHAAYGTVAGDLLVAATATVLADRTGLAAVGLLAGDPAALAGAGEPGARQVPPCPMVVRPAGGAEPAVRSARAAVRSALAAAPSWAAARAAHRLDDVVVPDVVVRVLDLPPGAAFVPAGGRLGVTLAGDELVVHGPGPVDALAAALDAALAGLCEHCTGRRPVYSAEDFPDAGLDDAALRRLLADLGVDGGER